MDYQKIVETVYCYFYTLLMVKIISVVQWSEFLATDPEVPVSIPGATRFSEK
jgi:hypothetical protein